MASDDLKTFRYEITIERPKSLFSEAYINYSAALDAGENAGGKIFAERLADSVIAYIQTTPGGYSKARSAEITRFLASLHEKVTSAVKPNAKDIIQFVDDAVREAELGLCYADFLADYAESELAENINIVAFGYLGLNPKTKRN